MKRGKNKSGALKGALYAIAIFNFLNLFIHMFSLYKPIIISQMDYALYGVKILLYFLVYRFLKRNVSKRFRGYCALLKATMILDIIELFISVVNSTSIYVPYIIMLIILTKLVLNYLSYIVLDSIAIEEAYCFRLETIRPGYEASIKNWSTFNFFIVLFAFFGFFIKMPIFMYWLPLLIRFIYELKIIRATTRIMNCYNGPCEKVYDNSFGTRLRRGELFVIGNKTKWAIRAVLSVAVVSLFITGMYLYYSYDEEDYSWYLQIKKKIESDESENTGTDIIFEYDICNKMPEWTGLQRSKYGFINEDTKKDSGPCYKWIDFDENGVSWDGIKSIIDTDQNVVTHMPLIEWATLSHRQHILRALNDYGMQGDDFADCMNYSEELAEIFKHEFRTRETWNPTIFVNGVTVFYSELTGRYGLLKDDGRVVAPPKYKHIRIIHETGLAYVYKGDSKSMYIIGLMNPKGKLILNMDELGIEKTHITDSGDIEYEVRGEKHVIDNEGNIIK